MDSLVKVDKVTMINPRGSLREVHASMVAELKVQGWKIVINPKREYYPELDSINLKNKMVQTNEYDDEVESVNILQYEEI